MINLKQKVFDNFVCLKMIFICRYHIQKHFWWYNFERIYMDWYSLVIQKWFIKYNQISQNQVFRIKYLAKDHFSVNNNTKQGICQERLSLRNTPFFHCLSDTRQLVGATLHILFLFPRLVWSICMEHLLFCNTSPNCNVCQYAIGNVANAALRDTFQFFQSISDTHTKLVYLKNNNSFVINRYL